MRKYTVETLKKENELFDRCYGINNADVERVNHLIDMIEKSRSVESIQTFDVVEYTNEYGEYFPKATVTMKEEEDIELCENAGIHLNIYDDELCGSASGGAFSHHKESEFVYKGTAVKTFWTWGNVGARANGGIYFTATVNLWECNNNKEMFSTKTHDKYYLSHRKSDNDYQYFASWNALSSHAWKTKKEMQAWLRTYRAVTDGKQKIYKKDGTLLKTKKIGPQVINKETLTAADSPDKSKIKSTLDKELARVSSRVEFDTKKANDVLTKLNAQRKSEGLSSLSMDTSSEAYKLACIRAADMAIYDYSSSTSPMYGTLNDMCNLWKISSSHPSENIWKAPSKTADEIHSRFQSNDGSRKIRMSNGYSNVGIAVIEKNGNTYIAEIYLS